MGDAGWRAQTLPRRREVWCVGQQSDFPAGLRPGKPLVINSLASSVDTSI